MKAILSTFNEKTGRCEDTRLDTDAPFWKPVHHIAEATELVGEPKPRLGDYYAGDTCDWWKLAKRARRFTATEQRTFAMGESFFISSNLGPPIMELTFADFAVASDAFAFGAIKYGVGCWREVSSDEHFQGAGRHFKTWLEDPQSKDTESGLIHEAHFLARAIMCLEQRRVGK